MSANTATPPFEALDTCHRQIQQHLDRMKALIVRVFASGVDADVRAEAGAIEAFFSGTSRQHHQDEETQIFPQLLATGDAKLASTVHQLRQDHGWIEQNWLELAPQMRAIALGNGWADEAEFLHYAEVFHTLCHDHIALEESLIYPESKALYAQALAAREQRQASA